MRTTIVVLSILSSVLVAFIVLALLLREGNPWKPSGDGRTIVNTRTGEIRVTATGETIQEYRQRESQEAADRVANDRLAAQEREALRLNRNAFLKSLRDAEDERRLALQKKAESERALQAAREKEWNERSAKALKEIEAKNAEQLRIARAPIPGIKQRWRKIERGMSESQVREVLGDPEKRSANTWSYSYPNPIVAGIDSGTEGTIQFSRGTVQDWKEPFFFK